MGSDTCCTVPGGCEPLSPPGAAGDTPGLSWPPISTHALVHRSTHLPIACTKTSLGTQPITLLTPFNTSVPPCASEELLLIFTAESAKIRPITVCY